MSIREARREAAIERMADHLLLAGASDASLRALAAAAGASDRMLLYYFSDKDELLAATLERVASRFVAALDAALPSRARRSREQLVAELWAATGTPELRRYLRIWLDLASGAAKEREPHRTVAGRIAGGFVDWIALRLATAEGQGRVAEAAAVLAAVDGLLLLDATGRRDIAEAAVSAMATDHQ